MDPNDVTPEEPNLEEAIFQSVGAVEVEPDPVEPATDPVEPPVEEVPAADPAVDPPADPPAPELSDDEKAVEDEMKALGLTKEDTQKRFRELANEAREGRQYRETVEKQEKIFRHLEDNGITGEQFGLMTAIAADINSRDPVRLDRAYQQLSAELSNLAKALGKEAPGYDPLAEAQDLARKVEDGELDRATALELAGARRREAALREHSQTVSQQSQQTAQLNAARDGLNQLEATLKARDPMYAQKRAILEPIMRQTLRNVPPSEWAATYADAYAKLNLPAAAPAATRPAPDNPRRPAGGAGGATPKNAEEAVMAALGLTPGA